MQKAHCNLLICGLTGAGKTSLIQILNGGRSTPSQMQSDTQTTTVIDYKYDSSMKFVDSPGFLDNKRDTVSKLEELYKNMVTTINSQNLQVSGCLLCVASDSRNPLELMDWLASVAKLFPSLKYVSLVVTKVNDDEDYEKSEDMINKMVVNYPGKVFYHGKKNFGNVTEAFDYHRTLTPVTLKYDKSFAQHKSEYNTLMALINKEKDAILSSDINAATASEAIKSLRVQMENLRNSSVQSGKKGDITIDISNELSKLENLYKDNANIVDIQERKKANLKAKEDTLAQIAKIIEEGGCVAGKFMKAFGMLPI